MEHLDKFGEYAPYILIVILFIWQNNVFVRPEQLEKKHREILKDMKQDFVELNAYKEFQNHVMKEIETIKSDMNKGFEKLDKKINNIFDELKEILMKRRKDDV